MSTASPGIAFRPAPTERCTVTPCASRTFAWQVYVLLHGDNVLTDILVAIDAAVHEQGLQAAKVRESVFKLSSCLQSTLKFSSPAARYRCTISSPAAGLGRAAAAPATPADLCSLPPPPRIGHRPMGIALFLHHVCAMAVCVGECVPVCTACGGSSFF